MKPSKLQFAILGIVMTICFAAGRATAQVVGCQLKYGTCTYVVMGCYDNGMACTGSQFGNHCWTEYGTCCPGPGSTSARFCSTMCDGTGGGSC